MKFEGTNLEFVQIHFLKYLSVICVVQKCHCCCESSLLPLEITLHHLKACHVSTSDRLSTTREGTSVINRQTLTQQAVEKCWII